jgi:hypothetical protein
MDNSRIAAHALSWLGPLPGTAEGIARREVPAMGKPIEPDDPSVMTTDDIKTWIGFRFSEWAILRERDGKREMFSDYLMRMDGASLNTWAQTLFLSLPQAKRRQR